MTKLTNSKLLIEFKDLKVNMRVQDENGKLGRVDKCNDIHNVFVTYDDGGTGLHCLVKDCNDKVNLPEINLPVHIPNYDPLFYVEL